ncbi:M48 family metalloprotease [Vicingus serpentipes]|uniref:M48 family metalloprotease n=1 Tax=Vicingus serpentipes TaxID=1926625 RepID=A0A5C6RXH0_9FLAO|nr:M48 family metalloprotease [Vicingus serpentipes]TXB66863.1 M48 family metalloprotease [Vicingus serpentipes]
MKNILSILIVSLFLLNSTVAQICGYNKTISFEDFYCDFESQTKDKYSEVSVSKILDVIGASKSFVLLPCDDMQNCFATTFNGVRYIVYDKGFLDGIANNSDSWSKMSILAHEIGHHINGHTVEALLYSAGTIEPKVLSERRKQELEADEFSGFVLGKLGATLEQCQSALTIVSNNDNDLNSTHPKLDKRLQAIKNGYDKAKSGAVNICLKGDCLAGQGIKKYKNGTYEGEFLNGKRNGHGIYYWNNGDIYKGMWENNFQKGLGERTYIDGSKYKGNWDRGKKDGFGKMVYNNSSFYSGTWENDLKDGFARTFSVENGNSSGFWIKGEQIPRIRGGCLSGDCDDYIDKKGNVTGQFTILTSHTYQKGDFIDGLIVKGKVINHVGNVYVGRFDNYALVQGYYIVNDVVNDVDSTDHPISVIQFYNISGTVLDLDSIPLSNVKVKMVGTDGSSIVVESDVNGSFLIGRDLMFPETSYGLLVSKPGYFSVIRKETTVGIVNSKKFFHEYRLQKIEMIFSKLEIEEIINKNRRIYVGDRLIFKDEIIYLFNKYGVKKNNIDYYIANTDYYDK